MCDLLNLYRVAGWRQKEKPLLYNVFHIGDQIMRVSHCNVSSSVDVNRLIKNESSGQVNRIFLFQKLLDRYATNAQLDSRLSL